jgi:hypothetical protein
VLWNPWEVVRQRMQLDTIRRSFGETLAHVTNESGVRGLYAGIGGYLALWGTYSPLMLLLYEQSIGYIYTPTHTSANPHCAGAPPPVIVPSFTVSFGIGSFAGFVASCITSPLDVVKTRLRAPLAQCPQATRLQATRHARPHAPPARSPARYACTLLLTAARSTLTPRRGPDAHVGDPIQLGASWAS